MEDIENSSPSPIKALLVGYIGGINVGDEAIAGALAITLKKHFNADVTIISGQTKETSAYLALNTSVLKGIYPGKTISFHEYLNMVKAVKKSDVIVFVGGGILQDVHSTSLLSHCCTMALLGQFFGKKNIAIGIGAGPISSKKGKSIASTLLKNIDRMLVRDQHSYDYIKREYPENIEKISKGSDSIFLLKEKLKPNEKIKKGRIGLCFRSWPQLNLSNLSNLTELLIKENKTPIFFAYEKADLKLYEILSAKFQDKIFLLEPTSLDSDLQRICDLDGLISMRLHANLFAIMSSTPFIALSYDEKVTNVISQAGYPNQVLSISTSPELILNRLDDFDIPHFSTDLTDNAYQGNINRLSEFLSTDYKNEHTITQRLGAGFSSLVLANQILVMPSIRNYLISIADKIGHLFSKKIKDKIKKIVGIKW